MRLYGLVIGILTATASLHSLDTAFAQDTSASRGSDYGINTTPQTKPAQPPAEPLPDYGLSQGYFFNLRPLGLKLGKELADKGIYLTGRTFQLTTDQASGGLQRGVFHEGFNLFGFNLDMKRIAGIDGGSFHFLANDLTGVSPQKFSGAFLPFSRPWANSAAARLNEFSYEQRFMDGKINIRVGRLPVGTEFDYAAVYCEFVWGMCATPTAFSNEKGYAAYLNAQTAGVARVDLSHNFYVNVGAYEDEPSLGDVNHYGWPGEDWAPDKFRGVTIPMQFGYRTTFNNDYFPRAYAIGGLIDTGNYNDPLANGAGQPQPFFGGSARVDHGKSALWLQGEQTVYRMDPTTKRRVYLLGGVNFTTRGNIPVGSMYFGGVSVLGPFAARPNDVLNMIGSVINFSNAYSGFENTSLAARGYTQTLPSSEKWVEVNYGIALAPGIYLKPNVAYIWNPDQVQVSEPVLTDRRALYIGVGLSALFNEALGLPRLGER